jgi:cold shock CspA family protein
MTVETAGPDGPRRYEGKVDRLLDGYGFIASNELGADVYFRSSWFSGGTALCAGEEVIFEIKRFDDRITAVNLARPHDDHKAAAKHSDESPAGRPPTTERLLQWAYLGYLPKIPRDLATLAHRERWEFKNTAADPDHPAPVLLSYLLQTFGRLVLEEKIRISPDATFAAFNTGLVDPRYEPIYALLRPNSESPLPWRLSGFCIPGEGTHGQNLVRHFNPLPPLAHYFDEPSDLLYDTRVGKPEMDWRHVVIDRIDRYPAQFIEDNWPPGFGAQDTSSMTIDERVTYWRALGVAIEQDNRTYRGIINRVKDAVDLSVKRVGWNFKTAVPQYYPRVRRLQLLLPINLVSDEQADMALAVERTPSGSYLGHTVLALDWAYKNARLICRPDSDWLAADEIEEVEDDGADGDAST